MEKSIENIWKEGFLKNDALVAPKVNNLFNQKSLHITVKIKRMIVWNRYLLIFFGVVSLVSYWWLLKSPDVAIFLAAAFMGVVFWSKHQEKQMKALDNSVSSYEYLKSFQGWLKGIITTNSKVLRFFFSRKYRTEYVQVDI